MESGGFVLFVIFLLPSLGAGIGVIWWLLKDIKKSPIKRGIVAALIAWAMIGIGTFTEGSGFFDGLLRYDARYAGYFRLAEAIDAGAVGKAYQELKTTSPNLEPPFKASGSYRSPLNRAIDSGNVGMVRLVLEYGANPNKNDGYGSPLMTAIENDNVAMMDLLAQYSGLEDRDMALWRAAVQGKEEAVTFLLAHGANPNQVCGGESLKEAVVDEDRPDIVALLAQAPSPQKASVSINGHGTNEWP